MHSHCKIIVSRLRHGMKVPSGCVKTHFGWWGQKRRWPYAQPLRLTLSLWLSFTKWCGLQQKALPQRCETPPSACICSLNKLYTRECRKKTCFWPVSSKGVTLSLSLGEHSFTTKGAVMSARTMWINCKWSKCVMVMGLTLKRR